LANGGGFIYAFNSVIFVVNCTMDKLEKRTNLNNNLHFVWFDLCLSSYPTSNLDFDNFLTSGFDWNFVLDKLDNEKKE